MRGGAPEKGKAPLFVQIEAMAGASGQECRVAVIDITERKRAEDALRESEARMYRLTEMAADAIVMLNDSGAVTFCNAAAESMFRLAPAPRSPTVISTGPLFPNGWHCRETGL